MAIDECVAAVAVLLRQPLVILRRAEIPLDNPRTLRRGSALHDGIQAALYAVNLIITAIRRNKRPLQILAGGCRRPLGDLRTIAQRALIIQNQSTGFVLDLINRRRVDTAGAATRIQNDIAEGNVSRIGVGMCPVGAVFGVERSTRI